MTNLLWFSTAYREPDSFPLSDSFSDASPNYIYGALYGILSSLGINYFEYSAKISTLAFSKFLKSSRLTGPKVKINFVTLLYMRLIEKLLKKAKMMYRAMMTRLSMTNFSKRL